MPCARRRSPFARSLKREAKERGAHLAKTVAFWYRRKYNLSPRDPRFLELTLDDIWEEWWAHRFADDPRAAEEEHEDEDFNLEEILARVDAGPDDWEEVLKADYGRNQDPR